MKRIIGREILARSKKHSENGTFDQKERINLRHKVINDRIKDVLQGDTGLIEEEKQRLQKDQKKRRKTLAV